MSTAVADIRQGKQTLLRKFSERFNVDEGEVKKILMNTAFKVKDGSVTDEQMSALMIISNEYNLNPFTREIYAYPDKGGIVPVVGVDGWARIINEHPQMDGVEFVYSEDTVTHKGKTCHVWIECIITRKDRAKPTIVREYFDEVVRSVNYVTPWDSHPKRMHRHKTLIQCGRIAFGFSGIYDEDEAQRIVEIDVTPTSSSEHTQVYYTDSEFNEKAPEWENIVESGRKTPAALIATIESRGKKFTDDQKNVIAKFGEKPEPIEGEVLKAETDPFVAEMNAAEKSQGE